MRRDTPVWRLMQRTHHQQRRKEKRKKKKSGSGCAVEGFTRCVLLWSAYAEDSSTLCQENRRSEQVGKNDTNIIVHQTPVNTSKKYEVLTKKTCQLQFGRLMLKGMPKELARNKRSTKVCLSFPRARITRYSCSLHGETSCA